MSIYQASFAVLILLAIWAGRPPLHVAIIMVANLAASAAIGPQFEMIAAIDLLSAVLLIGGGQREIAVAVLFLCMAGTTTIASRLHFPPWAVSSGLEVMTALQCGVIGGADRGLGRLVRSVRGHWAGNLPAALSRKSGIVVARNTQSHRGGLNGR